jgi:predicted nucleic acid-binding protein
VARRDRCVASRPSGRGAGLDRLILDTTVIVAGERGRPSLDELIGDDDDVAVAAVTAAELLVGVELADAARPRRQALVDAVLAGIPIEDYDLEVARSMRSCSRTHAAPVGCGARTTSSSRRPRSPGSGSS